ncbi:methyltransferase domain-containing protein [Acidocella sp.]|uniref:methyltransferase domain-containing protein n=1 Tax=Acidocella sp. TaxID=50710 RepID=UPI00260A5A1B|nr:methyltransferase domain-containing protein [Acidocella sp.]
MQKIFDFDAMVKHRTRAARRLASVLPVLEDITARLLDRLDDTTRQFSCALDFGGRGAVAPQLSARGMVVDSADFSAAMAASAGGRPIHLPSPVNFGLAPKTYDVILAPLSLHFLDDLPGALIQLRQALKPEGLLLASVPVLGTLHELRLALLEAEEQLTGKVSPRVSPFPELRDCAGLLQRAGFAHPVADAEELNFLYANPLTLLRELRDAGETNALVGRSRAMPPRALFPAALAALPQENGRMLVALRMAVLTGWAS